MAYKPIHEELRELAAAILERSKTQTGQLLAGCCINRINGLANALEAKHNAGMDALIKELQVVKADPETPTLTVKQVNEAVDYAFKANWESGHYDSEQRFKRFLADRLQQNGG